MSSGADLFVVCKSCGSEVSAYITECPYCGNRLRKRAPKLDRPGTSPRRTGRPRRRRASPTLGRLRAGEMPGIRFDNRPYATIALVAATVLVGLVAQTGLLSLRQIAVYGPLQGQWWRLFTALLAYDNSGYLLCVAVAVAIFGWLLERRHGWWAPLLVFAVGGAGGMAVAVALAPLPLALGANGAALALVGAWALPDLRERRRGSATESDLLGALAIAAVLLLMALAVPDADPIAGVAGGVIGLALGAPLGALSRR